MKLKIPEINRVTRAVIDRLKAKGLITFKKPEAEVLEFAVQLVLQDQGKEDDLILEVNRMLDTLEKQNPGSFDRHKMFNLLKQKLAKDKGIVL
jgi:hypothetical protein